MSWLLGAKEVQRWEREMAGLLKFFAPAKNSGPKSIRSGKGASTE
jgi:hypothetical protein